MIQIKKNYVNFGEVRKSQLVKSTLFISSLVPLGYFQICSDAKERESGVQKATGSYRIYSSLVKLKLWFLNLRWKTCLWAELQLWCQSLQLKTCPWAEHTDQNDDDVALKWSTQHRK